MRIIPILTAYTNRHFFRFKAPPKFSERSLGRAIAKPTNSLINGQFSCITAFAVICPLLMGCPSLYAVHNLTPLIGHRILLSIPLQLPTNPYLIKYHSIFTLILNILTSEIKKTQAKSQPVDIFPVSKPQIVLESTPQSSRFCLSSNPAIF